MKIEPIIKITVTEEEKTALKAVAVLLLFGLTLLAIATDEN